MPHSVYTPCVYLAHGMYDGEGARRLRRFRRNSELGTVVVPPARVLRRWSAVTSRPHLTNVPRRIIINRITSSCSSIISLATFGCWCWPWRRRSAP